VKEEGENEVRGEGENDVKKVLGEESNSRDADSCLGCKK